MGSFALIAILMAIVGIYGVVAYAVRARTHEIGVRLALGATPQNIMLTILIDGGKLALLGLALGIPASLWLARFIASVLYGVSPNDSLLLALSALLVLAGALVACLIPALSARSITPVEALRNH